MKQQFQELKRFILVFKRFDKNTNQNNWHCIMKCLVVHLISALSLFFPGCQMKVETGLPLYMSYIRLRLRGEGTLRYDSLTIVGC